MDADKRLERIEKLLEESLKVQQSLLAVFIKYDTEYLTEVSGEDVRFG